jgi:hypothetical protein
VLLALEDLLEGGQFGVDESGLAVERSWPLPRGVVMYHQSGSALASMAITLTTDHWGQFRASAR